MKEFAMYNRYPCPCCGFLTLVEEPPGTYFICPVCFWEDDYVQFVDPDLTGGANKGSLNQARKNFIRFGAKSRDVIAFVRKPLEEEMPPEETI
jgi:hypothetical protein